MIRPNHRVRDQILACVKKVDGGKMKCKFCGKEYAEGTSITRIKCHLSGMKRGGAKACEQAPPDVKAYLAAIQLQIDGSQKKRVGSSSNEVTNAISTSAQQQGEALYFEHRMASITVEMELQERGGSHERPSINKAGEPQGDSSQPTDNQLFSPSVNNDVIMSNEQNIVGVNTETVVPVLEQSDEELDNLERDVERMQVGVQSMEQGTEEERICLHLEEANAMECTGEGSTQRVERNVSPYRFTGEATQTEDQVHHLVVKPWDVMAAAAHLMETRGDPLPTSSTMLKGGEFIKKTRKIRSWIMDDEVSTIGIYGMGLVGKTEMLKHIHNELLQSQDNSHRLYWVTAPQKDFSIETLQNLIAKRIDLDLSSEDDVVHRAVKLSKELMQKQKWILILDGLWNGFQLHDVGIPVSLEGCKLIVSTQSEEVCLMVTDRSVRVNPLSDEEALDLFMKKLGHNIELSSEKKRIAECIVRECGGLPQGIIAMAGSMKRLRYNLQWDIALKELEQSRAGESNMDKVFTSLKSSYTRLKKYHQKAGFLYCALFPKAFVIPKDDLIAYLIDEGVIRKQESREAEFCIGHSLLDRLEDVCLLESIDGGSAVKMHCLMRDMAIKTYQEYFPVIIKAGVKLKSLSGAEEWGEDLKRVSLIENQIKEIPSRHSPRCPRLSTLLLHYNIELGLIADEFFEKLSGLKILDLSYTNIVKIPDSVSNLVRLVALLLVGCEKLRHVPSLAKLMEMRRLDLYGTALEDIPQGLECLSKLRYLRMNSRGGKEFPGEILRKLSHLQVFILGWGQNAPMTVKGEEVGCLEKLEDLECHFKGHSDLEKFFNSRDKTRSLKTCKICVGQFEENDGYNVKTCCRDNAVEFGNLSVNKDRDFQETFPRTNNGGSMESLASSPWFWSGPLTLASYNGIFSGLKEFYFFGCTSMKKLFPLVFLPDLEVIEVSNCEKMEEIIETRSDDEGLIGELELPKLRDLKLIELPELKSIFSEKLICHSLKVLHVRNCEKLKRMPICLPLYESDQPSPRLSLHEIIAYPKEWWETELQWEHPNAKNVLRHLVKFQQETTAFNEVRADGEERPLI